MIDELLIYNIIIKLINLIRPKSLCSFPYFAKILYITKINVMCKLLKQGMIA
jgi:hypothetical protein